MRLSITTAINKIAKARFENMLLAGNFPDVAFSIEGNFRSYAMIQYSLRWSAFMKVLDSKIKDRLSDTLGVFTRKHSAAFLEQVKVLADEITEAGVLECPNRFKTMWD